MSQDHPETPAPSDHPGLSTSSASTGAGYDLRRLFTLAGVSSVSPAGLQPPDRDDASDGVELVEQHPVRLSGPALAVSAFIDGVQSALVVCHREHRPVLLSYLAAGAAAPGPRLVAVRERLALTVSSADADWLSGVNPAENPIPAVILDETVPPALEAASRAELAVARDTLERTLVTDLLAAHPGYLIVDGSLLTRPHNDRLVGVVKTSRTRYLPDESVLYGLRAGWRSPVFKIPAVTGRPDRYSAYVRLHDASASTWDFALVRVETFEPDLIDPAAVRLMSERQFAASADARWDRHLSSVAACEKLLRARRPVAFTLAG